MTAPAPTTLFTRSLSTFYSQWDLNRKISFLDEFTSKLLDEKRTVTLVLSRDLGFFHGRFTGLAARLLYRLDPDNFELSCIGDFYYVHRHYWDHPYLLKVVQRIGRLAAPEDAELVIREKILSLKEEVRSGGIDLEIIISDEISISEIRRRLYLYLTKSEEEVDKIIDDFLQEGGIKVDSEEVREYIRSIDERK